MRRDQLEHAIRTACQIIERPEVIVVGSQAILGTFREDELPRQATMSSEIDILPIADSNEKPCCSAIASRTSALAEKRMLVARLLSINHVPQSLAGAPLSFKLSSHLTCRTTALFPVPAVH
jgi:hypothetical protein